MLSMPEMKQQAFAHLVEGIAKLSFLDAAEIEEVAHALERASGVTDIENYKAFKAIAEIVRSYKEVA